MFGAVEMNRQEQLDNVLWVLANQLKDAKSEKERAAIRKKLREAARIAGRKDLM